MRIGLFFGGQCYANAERSHPDSINQLSTLVHQVLVIYILEY